MPNDPDPDTGANLVSLLPGREIGLFHLMKLMMIERKIPHESPMSRDSSYSSFDYPPLSP